MLAQRLPQAALQAHLLPQEQPEVLPKLHSPQAQQPDLESQEV
jgi:hypothetical protein